MFEEGRYSEAQLRRNRLVIAGVTLVGVVTCVVCGFATRWPTGNAVATSALIIGFAACFWWMFASRKAGPLHVNHWSWKRFRDTFGMR